MRILVAEDETIIRLDLRELLERAGFDVCAEAKDGVEAVELARSEQPDLAVLDVKMPRLDGIEAARRILDERPIPIVMLTAYGQDELVSRAVEAGVFGYLVKPFREQDLLPAIRTARARHEELSALREQADSLAEALAARKSIERAKGLLMEREGLTEQEAFARLRKASQVSGRPMSVVAEAVVATFERPQAQACASSNSRSQREIRCWSSSRAWRWAASASTSDQSSASRRSSSATASSWRAIRPSSCSSSLGRGARSRRGFAFSLCGGGAEAASTGSARCWAYSAQPPSHERSPPYSIASSRWATASSRARSCETSRTVPGKASSAPSSASRLSRSRWFVGSSRTRKFAPEATASASASRRRSPPESTVTAFSWASQPEKRN